MVELDGFGLIFSLILLWLKYFIFLPCLQLYASASASEVESVRKALLAQFEEVKLKQQLQFQEEIELLKCQSEVLLEQQIAQLKVGSGENALLSRHWECVLLKKSNCSKIFVLQPLKWQSE